MLHSIFEGVDSMNKYTESEKSIITSRYYDDSRQIFGAAKLCAVMKESGIRASREMVSELMRDMGFISIRQRSVPQSMDTGWLCIFFSIVIWSVSTVAHFCHVLKMVKHHYAAFFGPKSRNGCHHPFQCFLMGWIWKDHGLHPCLWNKKRANRFFSKRLAARATTLFSCYLNPYLSLKGKAAFSYTNLKLRKTAFGQQKSPIKSGFLPGTSFSYPFDGGEGGIWTPAPVSRPTPLAGAPLRPTWVLLRICVFYIFKLIHQTKEIIAEKQEYRNSYA